MAEFINPYQFVPIKRAPGQARPGDLATAKFDAGETGHVTHARYVPGTFSGRIVCRLETKDPLILGGERDAEGSPHQVHPYMLDGRPAIPGASLRGLFSSIVEAASDSAMRVLVNPLYTVRAAMSEFLPAIGMVVIQPDGSRTLRPLALGPLLLPTKPPSGDESAPVPPRFAAMFSDPTAKLTNAFLKVYLDGYQKRPGASPVELEFVPNSFLKRNAGIASASADNVGDYWRLRLGGPCQVAGGTAKAAAPRIKVVTNRDGGVQARWLLGQKAAPGQDPIPESGAEWQNKPAAERATYTRGLLRILGLTGRETEYPPTRKHEIFIPYPDGIESTPCYPIPDDVWQTFHQIADQRTDEQEAEALPFHVKGSRRNGRSNPDDLRVELRHGDLVYFDVEDQSPFRIRAIALSSIWRKKAGQCHDFFRSGFGDDKGHAIGPELLPFHRRRQTISIAELMFGFVEDLKSVPDDPCARPRDQGRALMGRVRFSAAVLPPHDPAQPPDWFDDRTVKGDRILKILSSPKPPSPNFYFDRRGASHPTHIPKSEATPDKVVPKGRKFYVHRQNVGSNKTPWYTDHPEDEKALLQKARVHPLRKGLVFHFHVDFENLSRQELALLAYALRPDHDFRHKLGMGKPLGLGAVEVTPLGVFYVDRRSRYTVENLSPTTPRYHAIRADKPDALPEWFAPRERREAEAQAPAQSLAQDSTGVDAFPTWAELQKEAAEGIPRPIHQALSVIGKPSATAGHDVHTPQLATEDPEVDTYKWFVRNDDPRQSPDLRQCLKPITGRNLPTLTD